MSTAQDAISARPRLLYEELDASRRQLAGRVFAWLFMLEWAAAIAVAVIFAPYSWEGEKQVVGQHVWQALFIGGLLALGPVALVSARPRAASTGHAVAAAQMIYSALLIHLSGGRIETHFHVFGSLAFLAIYRDWRFLATASVVVTLNHMLMGIYLPESLFGVSQPGDWRWAEHAGWVVFEDIVLVPACVVARREMQAIARQQAQLESSKHEVEDRVKERTCELVATADALRESEARTRAAMAEAQCASRAKSEFLANMSHEIRTPMTAILGYADMLGDSALTLTRREELVGILRRNGEHLLLLINDMLDMSKIEAGRMEVESVPCSPAAICSEVQDLLRIRAEAKSISLLTDVRAEVPRIFSDPLRLRQILVNLVGNAIKFTPSGSVTLSCRAEEACDAAGKTAIVFSVTDTGIGMGPEIVQRLFQPFMQADGSMSRRFGGTGLGLFISQRLASRLGGQITVQSEPGAGSTFTLRIVAPAAAEPASTTSHGPREARTMLPPGSRILYAEDGIDNQRLISALLRRAGADVVVASDGVRAIQAVEGAASQGVPFDMVLMDMQMPEMDGYQATSVLRARGWTRPIVAITAHAMSGDRQRCLDAGCDDYLPKPISRVTLVEMCGKWLDAAERVGMTSPAGSGEAA